MRQSVRNRPSRRVVWMLATAFGLGAGGLLPAQARSYHAVYDPNAAYDPDAIYDMGTVQTAYPAYRAPGPAEDPWGPYIRQAARRFAIPETWIRAVMQQESGGKQYLNGGLTTSGAGAMGLMQLMPATYADMQSQYGLGEDPYNPKDNIQAGAAYIRLMYDRYGAPGFLAAYNAGPDRVDDYLNNGRHLPDETVNYVAAITPHLGGGVAVRGKWAPVPVQSITQVASSDAYYAKADLSRTADGCLRDPDAAYDPSAPCLMDRDTPHPDPVPEAPDPAPVAVAQAETPQPAPPAPVQTAALSSDIQPATRGRNASPSFTQSSSLPPARVQNAVYTTTASSSDHMLRLPASYSPAAGASRPPVLSSAVVTRPLQALSRNGKGGTVQVGAFASYAEARHAAERVNRVLASRSMQATPTVQPVSVSGKAMYRAQLIASGGAQASGVCQILHARSMPCFPVRNS
ncbi:transglycosylase SLT domain-containing protein [Acetobacter persici]|uniref:lytic transglycosylase domain-containing protein n=1 Tax=Acetobacter persici TaxID=1076596 RepID=UPI0039EC80E6